MSGGFHARIVSRPGHSRHGRRDTARRTDLFAGLDQDELDGLARRIETVEAREGQVIFAEGAEADRVDLIGTCTMRIGKNRGMRAGTSASHLATLEAGDVFGEMALVPASPRTAAMLCVRLARADDALIGLKERSSTAALGPADLDTVHERLFRRET